MATIIKKTAAVKKRGALLSRDARRIGRHPAIMSDEPGARRASAGKTLHRIAGLSPMAVIEESKHGIQAKVVKDIQKETGFSSQDLAGYLQINQRTMQRYLQNNALMDSDVSERALLIAQITEYGREVFGNDELFKLWFYAPSFALGGTPPAEFLHTMTGMQLVKAELIRIQHGVY